MKIVINRCLEPPISYCWRDDWYSTHDSIYSLLSKFSYLNKIGARQLAELFLSYNTGKRTKSIKGLNINLLDSNLFDLEVLSKLFGIKTSRMPNAFLYPNRDRFEFPAYRSLRYCPTCLAEGFHATIYQMDMLGRCPVHGSYLLNKCPNCDFNIPYTLNTTWFNLPYHCPTCHADLAPKIHSYNRKEVVLCSSNELMLDNTMRIIGLKNRLFPVTINLDRYFSLYGHGYNMITEPDIQRRKNGYFDFLHSVMIKLEDEVPPLNKVKETPLLKCQHTGYMPLEQRWKRSKSITRDQAKVKKRWLVWDDKYWSLYPLYATIRRHLWRHIMKKHQVCVKTIAQHIWWRLEDDVSKPVCPYANAFLHWRMFWEGYGVPGHLFQDPTHPPTGLLVWLCSAAPICPNCWPNNLEEWVMHRIFAMDCMNSFKEWLEIAEKQSCNQEIMWSRQQADGHSVTYWAIEGENWPEQPLNLYLERAQHKDKVKTIILDNKLREHINWNREQIKELLH